MRAAPEQDGRLHARSRTVAGPKKPRTCHMLAPRRAGRRTQLESPQDGAAPASGAPIHRMHSTGHKDSKKRGLAERYRSPHIPQASMMKPRAGRRVPPRRVAGRDARARTPRQVRGRAAGGHSKKGRQYSWWDMRYRRAPGECRPRAAPPAGARGPRAGAEGPGRGGRSPAPKQEGAIKGDLGKPPGESGFGRGVWNSKMLARRMQDRFGIICSRRTAPRVAGRLGFSARKSRPVPRNGAGRGAEGRATLSVYGAALRDLPASRRGLWPRGGRGMACASHPRKPTALEGQPL